MATDYNDSQRRPSSGDRRRPARRSSSRSTSGASSTARSSRSGSAQRPSASRGSSQQRQRKSASSASSRQANAAARRSAATKRVAGKKANRQVARASAQQRRKTAKNVRRNKAAARRSVALSMPSTQIIAIGAAVCLVLVLLLHHFLRLGITVNDKKVTVWRGTTIEKLVDKGYATPTPGNLLAVDGSVIAKGEGELCTATIGGTTFDKTYKVHRGDLITIKDGGDLTEEYTSTEEAIPYGTASDSREFEAYWFGSIHLLSDGQEGVRTIKTGKVSGKTVDEVTKPAIDAGYRIYTASPKDKVVALTFDDGPWPETTGQILDILEQYGAKATFFTIGSQISEYADEVRRAHDLGCEVCTHTWDHAAGSGGGVSIATMSAAEQVEEVQKGYESIAQVLGEEPPHVMRAPGGNFYGEVIDNLWSYVDAEIGWDVDTEDWQQPGADAIAEMILSVQPGQVVLMHDGGGDRSQTVEALRTALPQLVEQGYSFVTIDELLAYGQPEASSGTVSL